MKEYGKKFGYKKLQAGAMPRLREALSKKQLDEKGLTGRIAGMHSRLEHPYDGDSLVLYLGDLNGKSSLDAQCDDPWHEGGEHKWYGGFFVFYDPQVSS